MKITKWVLANLIFPVAVGVFVASWGIFQYKIIAFIGAFLVAALIGDLILLYPRISGYIKGRAKIIEPKKVSLASSPMVDKKISLKLCSKVYIFVRRIEIGTKDKWFIIHPDNFSLDAGYCKDIEFAKIYPSLGYFSLIETHQEDENRFERFRYATHSFDIHIGFKFSRNGADQDRFWCAKVAYSESGQISVEIEDLK